MNKIFLLGRLGKDVETRITQNGTMVASFSLAVNRRFNKDGESECDWFNCTCFGKLADFVDHYLKQGTKIVLSGRIENNNYTNKKGEKVYNVVVIAEEIEFAESKGATDKPSNRPNVSGDGFMNIPEGISDELPFN